MPPLAAPARFFAALAEVFERGWQCAFAAVVTNVGYAQGLEFAKLV